LVAFHRRQRVWSLGAPAVVVQEAIRRYTSHTHTDPLLLQRVGGRRAAEKGTVVMAVTEYRDRQERR